MPRQLEYPFRWWVITPELIEELDDHGPDLVEDPPSRPDQEAQGRQKSVAALKPFDPYAVLARLSGPMTTNKCCVHFRSS